MQNVTVSDFIETFIVNYIDVGLGVDAREEYMNLYLPRIMENGYKLHTNFFGVKNNTLSNHFWVLPNEFKTHGITYEVLIQLMVLIKVTQTQYLEIIMNLLIEHYRFQ